jgi:hypothetical protein
MTQEALNIAIDPVVTAKHYINKAVTEYPERLQEIVAYCYLCMEEANNKTRIKQDDLTRFYTSVATVAILGKRHAPHSVLNDLAYFMQHYTGHEMGKKVAAEINELIGKGTRP